MVSEVKGQGQVRGQKTGWLGLTGCTVTYFSHRVQVLPKQTGVAPWAFAGRGQGGVALLH